STPLPPAPLHPRALRDARPISLGRREAAAIAVAEELLDAVAEQPAVRPAAVEDRRLVPARERVLDDRAPEELRPAEDEEPHSSRPEEHTSELPSRCNLVCRLLP